MKKIICFDLGWTLEDESQAQIERANQVKEICAASNYKINSNEIIRQQMIAGKRGISSTYKYSLEKLT